MSNRQLVNPIQVVKIDFSLIHSLLPIASLPIAFVAYCPLPLLLIARCQLNNCLFEIFSGNLSNLLPCRYSYIGKQLLNLQTNILTDTVLQASRGNVKAQAALYQQFSKAMFNICMRMAGNRLQAEDMLHDAFLLAFKSIGQLKQPEAVAGWLRRIVVNECIRQSKMGLHWDDWEEKHDAIANGEDDWWQGINLELVHREIKNLPDGCRQVFVLYALEDYAHKDIAANLGISESTSKSQYHRSRTLLRERILKQMRMADG